MSTELEHRKVLVVGGSSGIGLAVAGLARKRGAQVVVASRSAPTRVAALPEPLRSIEAHAFDITAPADCERLVAAVGTIDHLVVAVRPDVRQTPFETVDTTEAKQAFETKFWGPHQLVQVACRHMNEAGSVTLTSGIAGAKIYNGVSTMAIVNSATEALCRSLAVELAPLRVNCVSPGFVEPKPPAVQVHARQFPLKRLATLEEIASAFVWLMENPYVTGNIMAVDGGAMLV